MQKIKFTSFKTDLNGFNQNHILVSSRSITPRNSCCKLIEKKKSYGVKKARINGLLWGIEILNSFTSRSNRSRKNITKLRGDDGNVQWSDASKAEVATAYFSKLFS